MSKIQLNETQQSPYNAALKRLAVGAIKPAAVVVGAPTLTWVVLLGAIVGHSVVGMAGLTLGGAGLYLGGALGAGVSYKALLGMIDSVKWLESQRKKDFFWQLR